MDSVLEKGCCLEITNLGNRKLSERLNNLALTDSTANKIRERDDHMKLILEENRMKRYEFFIGKMK